MSLMRVLSSLTAGEKVVDFVSLPAGANESDTSVSDEVCDNDGELCICCWDMRASFKMNGCGHLSTCSICRRRLIYRQLSVNSANSVRLVPRMRLLTEKHMKETQVKCPLCRKLDVMVPVVKACSS